MYSRGLSSPLSRCTALTNDVTATRQVLHSIDVYRSGTFTKLNFVSTDFVDAYKKFCEIAKFELRNVEFRNFFAKLLRAPLSATPAVGPAMPTLSEIYGDEYVASDNDEDSNLYGRTSRSVYPPSLITDMFLRLRTGEQNNVHDRGQFFFFLP